ncbi:MAG: hypothetical protein F9K16_00190 [Thermoanaerobaculia bacterium]|nr:MAG: hypothetical protein F9K16_00190 [Thermoanaerobaculia bacterium]MBZ0103426.1 hypothetical protein [Thermoanaerobaculia bacterium]
MTPKDPRSYVIAMLRRDLGREPTEREVEVWVEWIGASSALDPDSKYPGFRLVRRKRPER